MICCRCLSCHCWLLIILSVKMSSDLYYEDEGQSIVDSWLAGGVGAPKAKAKAAVTQEGVESRAGKRGLGFVPDKSSSSSSSSSKNSGARSAPAGKGAKRKLYEEEDEEETGLHGIVEDVIEKAKRAVVYSDQLLARSAAKASLPQTHNLAKSGSSGEAPRKKPKTRSKQKNIRRDNRPAEQRPTGPWSRPLTPQTKAKIGLAEATGGPDDVKKRNKKNRKLFRHLGVESVENRL